MRPRLRERSEPKSLAECDPALRCTARSDSGKRIMACTSVVVAEAVHLSAGFNSRSDPQHLFPKIRDREISAGSRAH